MRTSLSSLPFIIAILLCFIQCEKEQDPNKPVDIPDVEFLNALIEAGVDINGDGIISYGEAEKVTVINLDPPEDSIGRRIGKISNLKGLEAFINLDTLHTCYNPIQELDVSANTELKVLVCWGNGLLHLDLSNNQKLRRVSLDGNQLTSIDVSNASQLETLWCTYNNLTSLDVSNNKNLSSLYCDCNQLTKLDISNNIQLGTKSNPALSIGDMPALTEVCVWIMPFPPAGLEINSTGSPNVFFTTDCSK